MIRPAQPPGTGQRGHNTARQFSYSDAEQANGEAYIDQSTGGSFPDTIVTKIESINGFYPAEDYHQDFLATTPLSLHRLQ